jgi:DNA-binding XRE family transcriptional regulator
MTQADLAQKLELARQGHVSNLEMGRREPSIDLVIQIVTLFSTSTDYLLRDDIPVEEVKQLVQHATSSRMPQFGKKLRALRRQAGITQVELATKLGLTAHTHISVLESGRKTPSLDIVVKIADFFGVTTDTLLLEGHCD